MDDFDKRKLQSMIVYHIGHYQRKLTFSVLEFLTRYLHCVLMEGTDPGKITLEIKAERLKGNIETVELFKDIHIEEDKPS